MSLFGNTVNTNVISEIHTSYTSDFKKFVAAGASREALERFACLTVEEEQRSKNDDISLCAHCDKSDKNFSPLIYDYRNRKELGKNDMPDNQVFKFCKDIHADSTFLAKHNVKKIYAFYGMREIWVLTDKLSADAIISFDTDAYAIMKKMGADFTPMLIGTHEVTSENIPPFDLELEV